MSDSCDRKVKPVLFPIIGELINEGETILISVKSPDGDFMLAIDVGGEVVLEVFSPNHVVHRGVMEL